MQHRDSNGLTHSIALKPGEFPVVPRGLENRPIAKKEVSVLLFEPAGSLNTGTSDASSFTVDNPEKL